MAASAAVIGFGTTFSYLSTDPSTYTALGEVVNVTAPDKSRETIDVTHMASDDAYHEYIGALYDAGSVSVVMNYTEAGAALCETLFGAGLETFKITYPGASTEVFKAIPTNFTHGDLVIDDKMTMTLTMKISGKSAYTVV